LIEARKDWNALEEMLSSGAFVFCRAGYEGVPPRPCFTRMAIVALVLSIVTAGSADALSGRTIMTLTAPPGVTGFGYSVAGADVNANGFADVIAIGGNRAYLYYGGPRAATIPDLTFAEPSAVCSDLIPLQHAAPAGDFNGDGKADLIVTSAQLDNCLEGRAYIYYGGPGLDTNADLVINDPANTSETDFGASVASVGDVNKDGFDDVIVGNPGCGPRCTLHGTAFLIFGNGAGIRELSGNIDTIEAFGYSVAGAGDVNGDGSPDVIVGNGGGRAYIFYMGPGGSASPVTLTDPGVNHALLSPTLTAGFGGFGSCVSSAGDFNGDGYGDVVVSSPTAGAAFVYFGGSAMNTVPNLTLTEPTAYFGFALCSMDANADGYGDVIVGAPDAGGTGRVYVYLGGPSADATPALTLAGEAPGDAFGLSLSTGDVDGDGFADLIIGAPGAANSAGRVYVVSFHPPLGTVDVDLDPDVVNLASHAPNVTAYIEPTGFDPASIDISTLRLAESVPAEAKPVIIGDHNTNGLPDLMVKFSRQALDPLLKVGVNQLEVTGSLVTGEKFKGTGEVRVIDPTRGGTLSLHLVSPLGMAPVRLAVQDPGIGERSIAVYDVKGRLVRRWSEPRAEVDQVSWDGRANGGQAASGIYFLRITDGAWSGALKVVIAR